jgi:RNA polymerase sigma factor FliA
MNTGERTPKKLPANAPEVDARVREGIHLVRMVAIKLRRQISANLDFDDLQSMGREGLLEAARTYDPDRGVPFCPWAYLKIRGAVLDGLRRQADLPRNAYAKLRAFEAANQVRASQVEDESAAAGETAEAADERVASTTATVAMAMAAAFLSAKRDVADVADTGQLSPEAATMKKRLLDQVLASIGRLQDDEKSLLMKCYFEDLSLEEAGKSIGLSKSWVSRLHARALDKVAKDLKKRQIEDDT